MNLPTPTTLCAACSRCWLSSRGSGRRPLSRKRAPSSASKNCAATSAKWAKAVSGTITSSGTAKAAAKRLSTGCCNPAKAITPSGFTTTAWTKTSTTKPSSTTSNPNCAWKKTNSASYWRTAPPSAPAAKKPNNWKRKSPARKPSSANCATSTTNSAPSPTSTSPLTSTTASSSTSPPSANSSPGKTRKPCGRSCRRVNMSGRVLVNN